MKPLILCTLFTLALLGCSESQDTKTKADVNAGKAFADRECKGCHGMDGKGVAPGIPHLAGQRERYLVASLKEYKDRKRTHAALRDIAAHMSEADAQNVAGFYAGLPPIAPATGKGAEVFSPYETGKTLAVACMKCHGENGNSTTPGVPNLAGQQPRYLVIATQEYLNGAREMSPMHSLVRDMGKLDLESIALFFASQMPNDRGKPPFGDPAAGEPLSAPCGGCHGSHGVSTDASTPSLAAQDPQYLVESTKAYRKARRHETMQRAVSRLSDKDIENIAAFYATQKSRPAERGQTLVQELTDKCNRCHGANVDNPSVAFPNIRAQDKDYLIMALRGYRDDKRESSVMHKMSLPYGDSIIESIASYYAALPAK